MTEEAKNTPAAAFRTVYDNRDGLHVVLEAAERIDGAGRPYRHHRLITADGRPGAVIVATQGESVLVVRSRRDAAGQDLWELPRGFGDEIDSLHVETAIRELREETGYLTDRAELLGSYVTDSSIYPQRVNVARCEVRTDISPSVGDGEITEMRWLTDAEVWQAIADGMFADAHTLAGLALWGGWRASKRDTTSTSAQ